MTRPFSSQDERDAFRESLTASDMFVVPTSEVRMLLDALDALAAVERERDEARDWVRELAKTHIITCAYCGHAYPVGSPTHSTEELSAHIRVCEKHPMRAVEAQAEADRAALRRLLDAVLAGPRTYLGEDEKRAIDAAEARLAGAPPPVAHAGFAPCNRWVAGQPIGAEPPSERTLDMHERGTIQDAIGSPGRLPDSHIERIWAVVAGLVRARDAADLESLRADRALLRAYGTVMQVTTSGKEARKVYDAIRARALALAAQGRGEGGGK